MSKTEKISAVKKNEGFKDLLRSLGIAIILALFFRSIFFEPFFIPSGSMKPTLLVGDYVFVSKYTYGYSRFSFPFGINFFDGRVLGKTPERGDVIVFKLPTNTRTNYIKRLIGLPGDKIQVKRSVLYINGEPVKRQRIENFLDIEGDTAREIPQYIETLPNGVSYRSLDETSNGGLDDTDVYTVPPHNYFFMGDNRDNSQDSRVLSAVGFVPEENLLGPANIIFFSSTAKLVEVWKWISGMRYSRFLSPIKYEEN